ncbi:MAG: MFS transporter, partial [Anaerotignum sp.]
KPGLISGVTLMGFGFGSMLLGTLGANLITMLGWRTTFVIFGVVFGIIMLAGSLILKEATPEFLSSLISASKKTVSSVEELSYKEMMRRRNFWLYFMWAIVLSAAGLAIINSSTPFAISILGDDLTRAAAIAGIVSIFNGIGRVIFGQLFDSKGYRITMLSVCVLYAVSAGVLIAALKTQSPVVLIASFVLIGLSYGGVTPTNSAFTSYFFGRKHYALNFSITNANLIFASYLGPLCGGGNYMRTFIFIFAFAVIGFVITLAVKRPSVPVKSEV